MKQLRSVLFLFLALKTVFVFAMERPSKNTHKSLCCSACHVDDLVSAIEQCNLSQVNHFLFSHIDPNSISRKTGNPVLVDAARVGHLKIVESLLAAQADPNIRKSGSDSALSVILDHDDICPNNRLALIKRLLHAKADPNMRDSIGETPLFYAIDSADSMGLLLEAKADVNAQRDETGSTVLMCAAVCGQVGAVERLLQEDAIDINAQDEKGNTALILAALKGRAHGEYSLCSSGESEEWSDISQGAVDIHKLFSKKLKSAALLGCGRVVERLIQAGASLDIQDKDGGTALMYASLEGHHDMVQRLLQAGANTNMVWKLDGATALMVAAHDEEERIVAQLLQSGADVSIISRVTGSSAIIQGVYNFDILKKLITGYIDQLLTCMQDVDGIRSDELSERGTLMCLPVEIRTHCMSYLDRQSYGRVKQACKWLRQDAQQHTLRKPHAIDFICEKLWNLLNHINHDGSAALLEALFVQKKYEDRGHEKGFKEAVRVTDLLSCLASKNSLREFVESYLIDKKRRPA